MTQFKVRAIQSVSTPAAAGSLNPGDTITMGMTSEVKIDRDTNWIKIEVNSRVADNEDGEAAYQRIRAFTQSKFTETVEAAVSQIQAMGA